MLMSCSCRGMAGGESAMPQCKQLHPSTLQPHGKRTPSLIVLVRRRSLLASCQSSSAMGAYCTHPLPLVPPRARFHLILISPPVFMLRHGSCTTLTTTHVPRLVVRFLTLIIREGVYFYCRRWPCGVKPEYLTNFYARSGVYHHQYTCT
jgi:hypothetical protein